MSLNDLWRMKIYFHLLNCCFDCLQILTFSILGMMMDPRQVGGHSGVDAGEVELRAPRLLVPPVAPGDDADEDRGAGLLVLGEDEGWAPAVSWTRVWAADVVVQRMSLVRQSKIVYLLTKLFKTSIFLLLILLDSSDTNTKVRKRNVKQKYITWNSFSSQHKSHICLHIDRKKLDS